MAKTVTNDGSTSEVKGSLGEYEEAIRCIRDVMAARVVADERGVINEIHVLAGAGRGPKQIVRDIESTLMAQYGLPVDHKRISVAQVEQASPMVWGSSRLRLLGVKHVVEATRVEAEVRVQFYDVVHTGRASGPASSVNRLRVVAEATLGAVAEYFNSTYQLSADDVVIIDLRSRRVVLSMIALLTPEGEEIMTGSSLVKGNDAYAVARSVLDALNRRFNMIIRKDGAPGTVDESNSE